MNLINQVVFVQVGGQKKELRPVESLTISPKHRASISAATSMSVEVPPESFGDTADCSVSPAAVVPSIQHQHSLDQSAQTSIRQVQEASSQFDVELVTAEPLEKIFDNKSVREKRIEMEKKLDTLRRKHEKEKIKIAGQKMNPLDGGRKTKFAITNKLVKRLSSKSLDPAVEVPPCIQDVGDSSEDSSAGGADGGGSGPIGEGSTSTLGGGGGGAGTRTQLDRLLTACREYSTLYLEVQTKYFESIYAAAEKVLRNSQASQMKQLKASLDRVTSEVMHQLQEARRNEVKNLATVHRDRDELVRMKREVASSVVERGVAERVRLKQTFDKRTDDLQKQHDAVSKALADHKAKARQILDRDTESRTCIFNNGFLVLFKTPSSTSFNAMSHSLNVSMDSGALSTSLISPSKSHNNMTSSNNGTDGACGGAGAAGASSLRIGS